MATLPTPRRAGPEMTSERVLAVTAQAVRMRGVRGLDAESLAADIASKWLLAHTDGETCESPTYTFVRQEVWLWRRSERRAHARETEAGRRRPSDEEPAVSMDRQARHDVLFRAIRRGCACVSAEDRRALVMKLRGSSLAEIGKALGGSEARWSRRLFRAIRQLRRTVEADGCSADCRSGGLPDVAALIEFLESPEGPKASERREAPSGRRLLV